MTIKRRVPLVAKLGVVAYALLLTGFVCASVLMEIAVEGAVAPKLTQYVFATLLVSYLILFIPFLYLVWGRSRGFAVCDIRRITLIHLLSGIFSFGVAWFFTTAIFTYRFFLQANKAEARRSTA
jgi:hypothetical protein